MRMRTELDISSLHGRKYGCKRQVMGRLNLLEGRLVESHAAVIIPLDDCVIFVSSLNCAEFSGWLSEVAQTLDAISRNQLLAGGRGLRERWSPGTVSVRDRPSM